jgi:SWI/SNF related-matrix-associated actin-dependent regulator of chromatin subfamily C
MASSWTEEETLKLLDGIEEFGDRWDLISERVGTKSAKACLYQFLQFSIEDDLYSPAQEDDSENRTENLLWQTYAGQSSNPLMTFLSLLSTSLSPHIAAEAARAALEVAAEDIEREDIVFKGDQKRSASGLDLERTTRRAAEHAFDASLSYTRSLIDLEHKVIEANARILTEKQIQRVDLKLALLEDVMHQSNRV